MLVRKYQGRSEEEAIAKAKAELGPEAIILHIKQLSEKADRSSLSSTNGIFGLKSAAKVEVIVALDQDLGNSECFRAYAISTYSNIREESGALSTAFKETSEPRADPSLEGKLREQRIRCKGIKSEVDKSLGTAAQELYQHLLSHEVQEEVAQRLSLSIQELLGGDSSFSLREAMNVCIEELIRTSGGLNIAQKPAVVAFIGPTGVGKTTTIAKLAAHYHLRENQRISLITVDTYRIAAIEQLKTYATYIGIPLEVALTPQEMHQLVRKHKNCDLILIDTPGRSQKDSFRIQELKMILSAASPQEVHLLLNVTTQHRVLWDVVRGFKVFSPNRLLFTKLDESACFGHILNLSVALGKPVSYLTTGQDVPDDIQLATIERITEYLLREGDI